MNDIKIYQDEARAAKAENQTTGQTYVCSWTFSVNGQPCGRWFLNRHAAERCVSRLKLGRLEEAFGTVATVLVGGKPQVEAKGEKGKQPGRARVYRKPGETQTVETVSGKGRAKPRTVEPPYVAEVDGQVLGEYPTEAAAREAAAFHVFMTSGKLGRLREAEAHFAKCHGKKCQVTYDGKSVIAHSECGAKFAVGLWANEPPRFKQLPTG